MMKSELKPFQWPTAYKVLKLLPEDGTPISASELKKRAREGEQKLGFDTLFKYLNKLESLGIVVRHVDASARRPRVLYKKIPYEEFFGVDRKTFLKQMELAERLAPIFERLARKVPPEKCKKFYLSWQLGYFLIFPTAVVARAAELSPEKRKEYIDIMCQLYFYPKLLKLANNEWIKPEDWMNGLKDLAKFLPRPKLLKLETLAHKAPKKYQPEIRKLIEEIDKFEKEEARADSP